MARVLTNEKNYYDIADTIRQMKEVDTTYKPREMSSALKDIYSNEVEGVPPLTFESNGMDLLNYRIDGASGGVGDKTNNLFDLKKAVKKKYINSNGNEATSLSPAPENILNHSDYVSIESSVNYTFTCNTSQNYSLANTIALCWFDQNKNILSRNTMDVRGNISNYSITALSPSTAKYLIVNFIAYVDDAVFYLNEGTTTVFEPYGYKIPVVVSGKNLFNENSELNVNASVDVTSGAFPNTSGGNRRTYFFKVKPNTAYTFSCNTIGDRLYICEYNQFINPANYSISNRLFSDNIICNLGTGMSEYSFTTSSNSKMVGIYYSLNTIPTDIQIEIGNIATDYEPYHEPTTTNIYLDEPIEENESISLSDTEVDIPTIEGTNTLTIDTTVQPSNVYVQSRKDNDEIVFLTQVLEEGI